MQIRRFTAPDMPRALQMVRDSLGSDAVILSTGTLSDGSVEVSAAVERGQAKTSGPGLAGGGISEKALAALARRVEGLGEKLDRHFLMNETGAGFPQRPEVAPVYGHLASQEVDPKIIATLLDELNAPDGLGLLPRLSIRLKKMLAVSGPPKLNPSGPTVWSLVGPTGVGKTTTVAKLAATFSLRHGLEVGLITLDTYRMAAAEQLKVYGRILEVPTLVASDAAELKKAILKLSGKELILVDTVGRSPEDEENLLEMQSILESVKTITNHLVLACPTRDADQAKVFSGFEMFNPKSLIFTKLDETATFGPILNRVVDSGLPVSYLTFGQKVPEDLEEASLEGMARRLLPPRNLCSVQKADGAEAKNKNA